MTKPAERKMVRISEKRQLTIPQKYYEALGFGNEAECSIQADGILIRPLTMAGSDFSEQILSDLIGQGLSGQELLTRFKQLTGKIKPAVQKLIYEADEMAKTDFGKIPFKDLFVAEKS